MQGIKVQFKQVDLPNGERIAYREREGGEKILLLIHGNMTSSKHWDLVIEQLDPSYKVYGIDLRGFGASTYNHPITSIKDFADDVKSFVDIIGLTDFSIMGWSTGGAVAMQFVAEHPERCQKLILLASASTRGYPFYGRNSQGLPDLDHRFATLEEIQKDMVTIVPIQYAYATKNFTFLKAVWNALIYTKNQPNEEKYNEYLEDMCTQRNLAEVYHALNTFNISEKNNGLIDGNGLVKRIMLPVLVLRGDRDFVIPAQMVEEILEDIGENATFEELKDCGHSPLIDDLNQLLNKITRFLD